MKKIMAALLVLILVFCLVGCQKIMYTEADFIAKAREEFNLADAENIEMSVIGELVKDDRALVWVMSGNEFQAHSYLALSCTTERNNAYAFEHAYTPLERGTDIEVLVDWFGSYVFCVNNMNCKTIKITDDSGTKTIKVTSYPFFHTHDIPEEDYTFEYTFIDAYGNEIS